MSSFDLYEVLAGPAAARWLRRAALWGVLAAAAGTTAAHCAAQAASDTAATASTQHKSSRKTRTATAAQAATRAKKSSTSGTAKKISSKSAASVGSKAAAGHSTTHAKKRKTISRPTPRTIKLRSAFVASSQLRPMAQQLASTRTAEAYSGVENYARTHTGEAAAAAYLALGHAYLLDRRFGDAAVSFHTANVRGEVMKDYAEYLEAQADLQAGHGAEADALLEGFATRHPDSIFTANIPVMLASAYLQQGNPQAALRVLAPLLTQAQGIRSDYLYSLGRAYQLSGNTAQAAVVFRKLYVTQPLSSEAAQVHTQMQAIGAPPLTLQERKTHADRLFAAKRYADAAEDYHALAQEAAATNSLDSVEHDALAAYAAACDLKLKRLKKSEAERLPDANNDSGALRLYLLAELARNDNDFSTNRSLLDQMSQRFPSSHWLEEALYSAGNMNLLKRNFADAIHAYLSLVQLFPSSTYAPSSHWRAAWLNYRQRNYPEAARLFDEQLQRYPGGLEIPSALYWRGRVYEDEEHNAAQAENYYRLLTQSYQNYYYAQLARLRLAALPAQAAAPAATLANVHGPRVPELTDDLPENDVHLIKARLLANAGLNEYIASEIQSCPDSADWGAFAQAQIYASYGEYSRALQSLKHANIPFFSLPTNQVPMSYWRLLFPQPYWPDLVADAQRNGLDPYLVASLIRQESEFNPGAVSHANAYGLMQLLPSVGRSAAKKEHVRHFETVQLLNASTNLSLGTDNLQQVLEHFGGQVEYALAAYNAGNDRVREWQANGTYKDIPEFVESIPFSETREYVQAIQRNRQMYQQIYGTH